MLKRLIFLTIAMILMTIPASAGSVRLSWDHNNPLPDGYRVFQRRDAAAYDYTKPAWEGSDNKCDITIPEPAMPKPRQATITESAWDKAASNVTLKWTQPASQAVRKDSFVVRAFEGTLESVDSEEVSWTQTVTNEIDRWEILYAETPGGPYLPFTAIFPTEGVSTWSTAVTAPLTVVPLGESKTLYFTIVTFGKDGTFSTNSAEASVTIDRLLPKPPTGVSVTAIIPVE